MKGRCPICDRDDYGQPTLLNHLLTSHGERPVLARCILDLLDRIFHQKTLLTAAHDRANCLLCRREAMTESAKRTNRVGVEG